MRGKPFRFRYFDLHQHRCAMKVGTDSMILGAWAPSPGAGKLLDLGTGTGVLSLMMAQRFPDIRIDAIEIDREAALQAKENIAASRWRDRVTVIPAAIQSWQGGPYDMIISNPPYFDGFYDSPHDGRQAARAGIGLSPLLLVEEILRLLSDDGTLAMVVPNDSRWTNALSERGLYVHRQLTVCDRPGKEAKRMYLLVKKSRPDSVQQQTEALKEKVGGNFTPWYKGLTEEFHLPGAIS